MNQQDFNKARPSRRDQDDETGAWLATAPGGPLTDDAWDGSGFTTPPMKPGELLVDPAANAELDAIATEFLDKHAAAQVEVTRRKAASRMAATRAKRASIIGDLLDAGHTGPSVFAVILASPQYAAARAADPAFEIPAWVADEIRRQRP